VLFEQKTVESTTENPAIKEENFMNTLQKAGRASKYILATLGATLFGAKLPKPPEHANNIADLEGYVNVLVGMSRPPGLSLVVVKDGHVVYNKSFGLADSPNGILATPDTIYHWGSMTKPTTATAIMQLQERGALSIDDPVKEYLPDFYVQYPSDSSERIAIRHLLNHSSGISDPGDMLEFVHDEGKPFPDQVELTQRLIANNNKLQFEPGTQAAYSNLGYTVLGAVVEAVAGQPHKDYAVENIFRPLKMEHAGYVYNEETGRLAASGSQPNGTISSAMLPMMGIDTDIWVRESVNGRMWFKHGNADFTGAAGVRSPTTDAARFVMAFLNEGELDGARILSPESVAMMFNEDHVDPKGGQTAMLYKGVKHGLGWMIWPDGDRIRIMHPGSVPMGFSATMQLYPAERLGIIIHGNEWAYGINFRGASIMDSIAQLAANMEW
jgi:CubicO group peptidase (beta-lactamase class C family)